jgi:hypothetical protein
MEVTMSYPDEDHREYAPTARELIDAHKLIAGLAGLKQSICEGMDAFNKKHYARPSTMFGHPVKGVIAEMIDDLYADDIKRAQETIDAYGDGNNQNEAQAQYNSSRI